MTKRMEPTVTDLPEHRVEVVEAGQSAAGGWQPCQMDHNIKFDTRSIESYCFADWHPEVYDAFVLAAAVEYCDRGKRRQQGIWARDIYLRVRVHNPTLWSDAGVDDVLSVLTGDKWRFEFLQRGAPVPRPRQVPFTMDDDAYAVIPFSDGLDSLAVSCLIEGECGRLLRVRLGTIPSSRRNGLLPFAGVPFRVTGFRAAESSFRSRSFKFALLAGVAAFLAGLNKIIVAESGQGILGPSLVPVGQEYEDLRSHPYFLDRMSTFLGKLLGTDVRYVYPRIWHTKAETLTEYFRTRSRGIGAWQDTRSCWQDQRHSSVSGVWRQCGICSACLLRRMSLYAAGRREACSTYVWESLAASSFREGAAAGYEIRGKAMYSHFVSGVADLDRLAKLHSSPWDRHTLNRQIRRLCHSPGLGGGGSLDEANVRSKVLRLLEQHAREWREFKESLGESSFLVQLLEGRAQ